MEDPTEAIRLEEKTDVSTTERLLTKMGLKKGDTVLDAGAGTGAVARVMSKIVGDNGNVMALDFSAGRLAHGEGIVKRETLNNICFVQGDLYNLGLVAEKFDFVWCRFVLEYLDAPLQVVKSLWHVVKPGGLLVLGDLDGNMIFHDGLDLDLKKMLDRLLEEISVNFDPYIGRKLYRFAYALSPSKIQTNVESYHLFAGAATERDISNWESKLERVSGIGKDLFGNEDYARFCRRFVHFLRDQSTFTYSMLILVSAKKQE